MKKILAMAAVAALAAGASVYAANPFSDVSTSDWAYQAVSDLSDQGIVEGYPDGTFKGQNNVTRYEMAQIIARLMAKEDQYNAEQRATIDKLAGEYADELDSLGVRVGNLEKKVGNISWSGDARMRYQDKSFGDDAWNGRVRINAKAQVNDNTVVTGRLSTGNVDFKNGNDADVTMESMNVQHQLGKVGVTLGRYDLSFGNQGGWFYGDATGFDGAQVAFNVGPKVNVVTGYGQFNSDGTKNPIEGHDTYYAKVTGNLGFATLSANYIALEEQAYAYKPEIWGVGLNVPVGDFRAFGEYWKNSTAGDYDTAWNAGIGYGATDLKKPGTWKLDVAYNDIDANMYYGGTGLQTDVINVLNKFDASGNYVGATNVSYWNAIGEVVLAQNTYLHAEYAFAADAEGAADPDDSWTVSLNYKF